MRWKHMFGFGRHLQTTADHEVAKIMEHQRALSAETLAVSETLKGLVDSLIADQEKKKKGRRHQ